MPAGRVMMSNFYAKRPYNSLRVIDRLSGILLVIRRIISLYELDDFLNCAIVI